VAALRSMAAGRVYPEFTVICKSRIDVTEGFLELAQPPWSICLNCGEFAFSAPSCWHDCLSFALALVRLLPDYTASHPGAPPRTTLSWAAEYGGERVASFLLEWLVPAPENLGLVMARYSRLPQGK